MTYHSSVVPQHRKTIQSYNACVTYHTNESAAFFPLLSITIFVLALVQFALTMAPILKTNTLLDFQAYYFAANTPLNSPALYTSQIGIEDREVEFIYPPGAQLLLKPLSLFTAQTAQLIFTALSIGAFLASVFLTVKATAIKLANWQTLLIASFLLQTFPTKLTLGLGQINNFVLFFSVLGIYLAVKNKSLWGGVSLAMAITLKITPILVVPALLVHKKWSVTFWCLATTLILSLWQPRLFEYYLTHLLPSMLTTPITQPEISNQSLSALFFRLTTDPALSSWLTTIATIVIMLKTLLSRKLSFVSKALVLLTLASIVGGNAWQHRLVLAYPLIIESLAMSPFLFGAMWLILTLHFQTNNPILASYQTIGIMALLVSKVFLMGKIRLMSQSLFKKESN
jgi:hypothetical protein